MELLSWYFSGERDHDCGYGRFYPQLAFCMVVFMCLDYLVSWLWTTTIILAIAEAHILI